jgi:hypothetical protein
MLRRDFFKFGGIILAGLFPIFRWRGRQKCNYRRVYYYPQYQQQQQYYYPQPGPVPEIKEEKQSEELFPPTIKRPQYPDIDFLKVI